MTHDAIQEAWAAHMKTREALNLAVREKFQVGQKVKARWGGRWQDATISWVPYENGPSATHIYVQFPQHKTPKRYDMGGGIFAGVRTGGFDGASLS